MILTGYYLADYPVPLVPLISIPGALSAEKIRMHRVVLLVRMTSRQFRTDRSSAHAMPTCARVF